MADHQSEAEASANVLRQFYQRQSIPAQTYFSRPQVDTLLASLQIEVLEEREYDRPPRVGDMKHWHVFDIVAHKHDR
jgi:hypothetical protein